MLMLMLVVPPLPSGTVSFIRSSLMVNLPLSVVTGTSASLKSVVFTVSRQSWMKPWFWMDCFSFSWSWAVSQSLLPVLKL